MRNASSHASGMSSEYNAASLSLRSRIWRVNSVTVRRDCHCTHSRPDFEHLEVRAYKIDSLAGHLQKLRQAVIPNARPIL